MNIDGSYTLKPFPPNGPNNELNHPKALHFKLQIKIHYLWL